MKSDVVGPVDFEIKVKIHAREDREVITTVEYPADWRKDPRVEHLIGLGLHHAHDNYRGIVKEK
jgi:hypothetical protein